MNRIDSAIQFPQRWPKTIIWCKNMLCLISVVALGTINYPWAIAFPWIVESKIWITNHWYFVPLLLSLPVVLGLIVEFWDYWAKISLETSQDSIPAKQMLAVLTGLGSIVGMKCDRFGKYRSGLTSCGKSGCEVFFEITQPKSQIEEIVKQIYYSMKVMLNDDEIKMILVKTTRGSPVEWMTYLPSLEKPPDTLLNRDDTFISEVIRSGQLVFIDDIAKERRRGGKKKKRYLTVDGDGAIGSIVGIPIRNRHIGSDIRYVLTIKSDRINIFNGKFEKKFGKIMKEFTNRIIVEDNLLEIKSLVKPCSSAA